MGGWPTGFPMCGPQISCRSSTWELVRNAHSQDPPRPAESETLGGAQQSRRLGLLGAPSVGAAGLEGLGLRGLWAGAGASIPRAPARGAGLCEAGSAPAARPALEAAQTPPARASGWLARGPDGAAVTNAAAPPREEASKALTEFSPSDPNLGVGVASLQ